MLTSFLRARNRGCRDRYRTARRTRRGEYRHCDGSCHTVKVYLTLCHARLCDRNHRQDPCGCPSVKSQSAGHDRIARVPSRWGGDRFRTVFQRLACVDLCRGTHCMPVVLPGNGNPRDSPRNPRWRAAPAKETLSNRDRNVNFRASHPRCGTDRNVHPGSVCADLADHGSRYTSCP